MKIWFCLCSLFLLYTISILIGERYDVTYTLDRKHRKPSNYSVCIPLVDLGIWINESSSERDVSLRDLSHKIYAHFGNLSEHDAIGELKSKILDTIRTHQYYYHYYHFCLIAKLDDETAFKKLSKNAKFFIFLDKPYTFFINNYRSKSINQLIILNKDYPYSNCRMYREDKPNRRYNKFNCINKCLKRKRKLLKYWYDADESENVHLDDGDDQANDDEWCYKVECKWNDCGFIIKQPSTRRSEIKVFKAFVLMSDFDFYTQFVGLISMFVGISAFDTLSWLMRVLYGKLQVLYRKLFRNSFIIKKVSKLIMKKMKIKNIGAKLNLSFLVLCIGLNLFLFVNMIQTHYVGIRYPLEKEFVELKYELISIAICVPLDESNRTMKELELQSDHSFNRTVDAIYSLYINWKEKLNWTLTNKVFFRTNRDRCMRCFEIKLNAEERNFQRLVYDSKLVIKSKHENYSIFLFPVASFTTSQSIEYTVSNSFVKRCTRRDQLKSKCMDYKEEKDCSSRMHCIERCINRATMNRYSCLSVSTILDKDDFNSTEWNRRRCEFEYDEIKQQCSEIFNKADCIESSLELGDKTYRTTVRKTKKIDLFYEIITLIEHYPSVYKLILDMLNVLSLLFGLNALKLFNTMFRLIDELLFRIPKVNQLVRPRCCYKYFQVLNYSLCFIGFIGHSFFIFHLIIQGDLIYNQFYEQATVYSMPDLLFCFEIDVERQTDPNFKKTANHLNKLTDELNINSVFERIDYLNSSYKWTRFDFKSNSSLKISVMFYQNLKCFELSHQIDYKEQNFHYKETASVVRLYFNRTILAMQRELFFLSKRKDTLQLTKIIAFHYDPLKPRTYSIGQELYIVEYDDNFKLIKQLMSTNSNKANSIDDEISKFKSKFNSTCYSLPITESDFDLEIDGMLFGQLILQNKLILDRESGKSFHFERKFLLNYLDTFEQRTFDFEFVPIFNRRKMIIQNSDNYTKLIVNLLTVLTLWFDFQILNTYNRFIGFINQIKFIFNIVY